MTVNMPSIVSLFHSFFYFFYWERFSFSTFSRFMPFNISVFQLFALKIYGFFNFSVLLPLCSSVLGGFFILWMSDFRGMFGFRYICYCFLFSCFGPIAKMFSYYRVSIVARRWVLFWKPEAARFAHLLILFFSQSAIFGGRPLPFIFLLLSLLAFLRFSLLFYVPGFALLSTQCASTSQCFIGPYLLYRFSYA